MPIFKAMLFRTVFVLKPLEARGVGVGGIAREGYIPGIHLTTHTQTLQILDRIGLGADSVKNKLPALKKHFFNQLTDLIFF